MTRGVDPDRLVFAPRVGPSEHLARQRLADLFLDCLPYNAHTTASDALWVGLPILTRCGETFAGRVAASLLHAIGVPELVTYSDADYEALALRLACEPQLLAELRRKLQANRLTHPLFNARRFARHLEAAFTRMWDLWAQGEAPQSFAIEPLPAEETVLPIGTPAQKPAAPSEPGKIARTPYAACPLCGGGDHARVMSADGAAHPLYRPELAAEIDWRICRACGHIHTDGYFTADDLQEPPQLGEALEEGRRLTAPVVARIARQIGEGAWLDVEFGSGALLFTAAEWGYEPVGLAANKEAVAALRRLGVEAYSGALPELARRGGFGVISLADQLSREPFPGEALKVAHRLLRPNGVLFLSMPNREPMLFNLLQVHAANPHWGAIDHCHLFGRSRLYWLLRDCGFEPIDYQISAAHRVGMEVIARKIG